MILHVDMDAFYASIEERENPGLVGQPVVVGGTPQGRGVVAAANYEARRFGVHSAMPAGQALRLCPQAAFVRPRMELYARVSRQIHRIFARYTPLLEPLALDEAFLDVTDSERLFGDARSMARRIKDDVRNELALVASVGVAGNKFLAKLASALEKPDGLTVVPEDGVQAFLDPLPVTRVWGVGEAARATLEGLGIRTVAELRKASPDALRARLGRNADHLMELARGIDRRVVVPDSRARSISHETTFSRDVGEKDVLRSRMLALVEQVARRARAGDISGRRVQVKLRYGDFRTVTRARTLVAPTAETDVIWQAADDLMSLQLRREPGALRLIGVGLGSLVGADETQADLFAGQDSGARGAALDRVSDDIAHRFGESAVHRGGTLRR
jgi:DNA polymerase-4